MKIEYKTYEMEVKEFDEATLTVTHWISSERRDYGGDILYASKNERGKGLVMNGRPAVLLLHGHHPIIGGEPIAKSLYVKPGELKGRKGIEARTQFFPDDLGKRLWKKNTDGYMVAWSVGWAPLVFEYKTEKNGEQTRHVYEWIIFEYSLCHTGMQIDAVTPQKYIDEITFKFLPCLCSTPCNGEGKCQHDKHGQLVSWKNADGSWETLPDHSDHSFALTDFNRYARLSQQPDKFEKGIHAVWGIQKDKPVELQAIRFDKALFSPAEARKWVKEHDYKPVLFEPASEKCAKCGEEMVWKWFLSGNPEKEYFENANPCIYSMKFEESELNGKYACEKCHGKVIEAEEKGALPYKKTPLAPEGEKWSAASEVKKAEVKDLKIMSVWMDSEKADLKTSYKGPHHKADGDHACVWNGVRACAAVMMGARGGMDIPMADMKKCQNHLAGHYEDFGKGEPPWKKDLGIAFLKAAEGYKDQLQEVKDEALYVMAKGMIPELAEFFEPESKADHCTCDGEADDEGICKECNKPKKPMKEESQDFTNVLDAVEKVAKSFHDLATKVAGVMNEIAKLNARFDALSVKPGGEEHVDDGKNDNPPKPRKVIVINTEKQKQEEDEKKNQAMREMAQGILSQVKEAIERIVPATVKEQMDKLRGRVN